MKLSHCIIALAVVLSACKKANTTDKPIPDPIIPTLPVDTVKKLEFSWAKSFGGTGVEGIPDMATDDAGNVYLTGKFKGIVDFDLGAGVQNLTAGGDNATYFAKYDTNGVLVFVKDITVIGVTYVAMGADATGNVYFAGNFTGKVDIDKGPAVQKLDSKGGVDVFVVKYDTGGNVLSKFIIGNSGNESVAGLAVDRTGSCYLACTSNYVIDVDPGTTVKNVNRPKCFLAKYDPSGAYVFHKDISTFEESEYLNLTNNIIGTDDEGNVYAVGTFFSDDYYNAIPNHSSDKGKYSVHLIKFDPTGKYVYATPEGNYGAIYHLNSISIDALGNICVSGWQEENFSFFVVFDNKGKKITRYGWNAELAQQTAGFDNLGNIHALVLSDNNKSYMTVFKTDGTIISKIETVSGILVKYSRSKAGFYIGGFFYEPTADLNFDEGVDTHTSNGSYDVFLSKYELK